MSVSPESQMARERLLRFIRVFMVNATVALLATCAGCSREDVRYYRSLSIDGAYSICCRYEVTAATARRLADCYVVSRDHRQRIVSVKHWENGGLAEDGYFGAGVATLEVVYEKGLETRHFLDKRNHSARSEDGTTGEMLHVNALGHRVALLYLGPVGTAEPDSQGVAVVLWDTDSAGRRVRTRFLDAEAERVPAGDSVWERRYEYANTSFPTTVRYFNLAGEPIQDTSGVWVVLYSYDSAWNIAQVCYQDPAGLPACNDEGIARTEWHYDSLGYNTRRASYDLTGQPARSRQGMTTTVWEYSLLGRLLGYTRLDSSPEVAANDKRMFTRSRFEYDSAGRETAWMNLDENGMPAAKTTGVASWRISYGTGSQLWRETYLGSDGNPVANESTGVAATVCTIESGAVRTEYLGLDGKPTVHRLLGVSQKTRRWSKSDAGSKVEISYHDKDRNPVARRDIQAASVVFYYDDEHRLIDLEIRTVESLDQRRTQPPTWLRRSWSVAGKLLTYVGGALLGLYLFAMLGLPLLGWVGTAVWKVLKRLGCLLARPFRRRPQPTSNVEADAPAATTPDHEVKLTEKQTAALRAWKQKIDLIARVMRTYSDGDHERVLADVNEFIKQDPTLALGYELRGFCRASKWSSLKGETAIARQSLLDQMNSDYREALTRDSSSTNAHLVVLEGMILARDWNGALAFGEEFGTRLETPRDRLLWSWLMNITCALAGRPPVADAGAVPDGVHIGYRAFDWHPSGIEALFELLEQEGFDPSKLSAARAVHNEVIARQKKPSAA
jgi:hypothetical protein